MNTQRKILLLLWLGLLATLLALFIFNRQAVLGTIASLLQQSPFSVYGVLLALGALRGFTMIPSTTLIAVGVLFVPAVPLYCIIMAGIVISSVSVYYFFKYLHIEALLNRKYKKYLDTGARYLARYELPVITIWSFMPFLPTDVICYLSGIMRVNVYKFALGIALGESVICAIYIFGGKAVLHAFSII